MTQDPTSQPERRPRFRRWARRFAIACLLFLLLAAGVFALAYRRASTPPEWWAPAPPTAPASPVDDAELAAAVERGLTTALHQPRDPLSTWQVEITQHQLNAWLAHRFNQWLDNRGQLWPDAAGPPRLALRPGRVLLGVPLGGGAHPRIVSASFALRVAPTGALHAEIQEVRVGALELPLPLVHTGAVRATHDTPGARAAIDALFSAGPLLDDPALELEDGRRVRLVDIAIDDARLVATCRTDPP